MTGPAASSGPLTPRAAAELIGASEWAIRRDLNSGVLHGHRRNDQPGGHWTVFTECLYARLAGEDEAAQKRRCPVEAALEQVPSMRDRRKSRVT